jgi:hypothetical protein
VDNGLFIVQDENRFEKLRLIEGDLQVAADLVFTMQSSVFDHPCDHVKNCAGVFEELSGLIADILGVGIHQLGNRRQVSAGEILEADDSQDQDRQQCYCKKVQQQSLFE